jgi:hypothetical protein
MKDEKAVLLVSCCLGFERLTEHRGEGEEENLMLTSMDSCEREFVER